MSHATFAPTAQPYTTQTTVGQLVADRPDRSRLFMKLGIDYCCGGKLTLQDAAEKKGLDAASILATLTALETLEPSGSAPNPAQMSLTALADHIVGTHHAYLKEELPRLAFLTRKVAAVHGDDHPWLREVHAVYTGLAEELSSHLQKEEVILFPAIRNLEQTGDSGAPFGADLSHPVLMMEHEHAEAGEALTKLRALTSDFTPPASACNSFRAMLDGLEQLERDTHEHISKENNILFPRAMAQFQGTHHA